MAQPEEDIVLEDDEELKLGGEHDAEGKLDDSSELQGDVEEDQELVDLKRQVEQMQAEAERLEEIQKEVEAHIGTAPAAGGSSNSKDLDSRSIYIGNVDYSATPEELQAHFQSCGTINRVTILCDKFTGHPKGYAYIEFAEEDAIANAILLNETVFHNRQIKVNPKRTNIPGYNRGGWRGRARGFRGRGFGGYRGRGRGQYYHPYM